MANKGDFGYRNREGRSGLDPVESRAEAGRFSGFLITQLLLSRVHTRNIWVIVLMALFGVVLLLPLIMGVAERISGGAISAGGWVVIAIAAGVGLGLLASAMKNAQGWFSEKR